MPSFMEVASLMWMTLPLGVMLFIVFFIFSLPFTKSSLNMTNLRIFVWGYALCLGILLVVYAQSGALLPTGPSLLTGAGIILATLVRLLILRRSARHAPLLREETEPMYYMFIWWFTGLFFLVGTLFLISLTWPYIARGIIVVLS